jgi:hypothetical protein
MLRQSLAIVCAVVLVCAGCAQKKPALYKTARVDNATMKRKGVDDSRIATASMELSSMEADVSGVVMAAPRYIAMRHKLEIVEPGSGLAKSVEAVVTFCGTIQCEVLSSNISGTTPDATPSGSIFVRVVPQDLDKLLDFVTKQGKISQHSTETEDKTAAVVDIEARLKNQTDFRDNLRKMLTKSGVSVADLLQVQEKLAEAQAELDSQATQRKVLANETEKVAVSIEFHAEASVSRPGIFAPVGEALTESGEVLGESLAALITAIAAVIPWLIVLVPGGWLIVRWWKRWRERKKTRQARISTDSQG